eukprot:21316_1
MQTSRYLKHVSKLQKDVHARTIEKERQEIFAKEKEEMRKKGFIEENCKISKSGFYDYKNAHNINALHNNIKQLYNNTFHNKHITDIFIQYLPIYSLIQFIYLFKYYKIPIILKKQLTQFNNNINWTHIYKETTYYMDNIASKTSITIDKFFLSDKLVNTYLYNDYYKNQHDPNDYYDSSDDDDYDYEISDDRILFSTKKKVTPKDLVPNISNGYSRG